MSAPRRRNSRKAVQTPAEPPAFGRFQSLLLLAILGSALVVIYSGHLTRQLFSESQRMSEQQLVLDEEWGRLLIERSTWADHDRINKLARAQLSMYAPELKDVELVRADGSAAQ